MKLVLDAGHGGKDSGCVSVVDNVNESDYVLDMAKRVRALLSPYVDVVLTREDDTYISLGGRCRIANDLGADLFVSLHTNSADTKAQGYEVFTSRGTTRADQLAKCIASRHIEAYPTQRNRGIKEAGYYVLKYTNMPASLVEFGFFSCEEEATWLLEESTRDGIASALSKGILDFCGIKQEAPPLTIEDRMSRIEDHLGL